MYIVVIYTCDVSCRLFALDLAEKNPFGGLSLGRAFQITR